MRSYTQKEFWENYWSDFQVLKNNNVFFEKVLSEFPNEGKLIEIGGFPGQYSAYFKKKFNYEVTILDFHIDPLIINKIEQIYDIPLNSIKYVNDDFLNVALNENFDIVCSFGFIEHFSDTKLLINRHLGMLKSNGILLITIPNFAGLNGLIQKFLDKTNYNIHNIDCMNIKLLNAILINLNCKTFTIGYIGKPTVWLEKSSGRKRIISLFIKLISKLIKYLPSKNRFLSPYIYILVKK